MLLKELDFIIGFEVECDLVIDRGFSYDFVEAVKYVDIAPMYRKLEVISLFPASNNIMRITLKRPVNRL